MSFPWPQWTDRLKELRAAGGSATTIAFDLGRESDIRCTRNMVISRLHRIGLTSGGKKSAWTSALDEALKELWPQELSLKQLEKKLGISDTTISKRAKELGLPPKGIAISQRHTEPHRPDCIFGKPNTLKKRKDAPPLTPDQKEHILGQGKTLLEFDDHPAAPEYCRWPINDPKPWEGYLFCGAKIESDQCPYCGYHARMAYGRAA